MNCNKCGASNPDDAKYCRGCGNCIGNKQNGNKNYTLIVGVVVLAVLFVITLFVVNNNSGNTDYGSFENIETLDSIALEEYSDSIAIEEYNNVEEVIVDSVAVEFVADSTGWY